MKDRNYLEQFFHNNYLEMLLDKNLTIVSFTRPKNFTLLVYKDELFVFSSHRSLIQAYAFYNVLDEVCLEGLEYFKITRNYLNYMDESNPTIKKGKIYKTKTESFLVNYITKGYQNSKNLSIKKLDSYMEYIVDFCMIVLNEGIDTQTYKEYTAIVDIKSYNDVDIDLFSIDEIEPSNLTNKFPINKELHEVISNKVHCNEDAICGLFFIDGYKDCFNLIENRCGAFLYYAKGEELLHLIQYDTISKIDIIDFFRNIFLEEIPVTLTTDNSMLYDILQKTFKYNIDFVLDKTNRYCRLITQLALVLTLNHYDTYSRDAFCMVVENNYNSVNDILEEMEVTDYESILEECLNAYRYPEQEFEDVFEYDDEEVKDVTEVDSELIS